MLYCVATIIVFYLKNTSFCNQTHKIRLYIQDSALLVYEWKKKLSLTFWDPDSCWYIYNVDSTW